MKGIRKVALGLVACLAFTAVPVYASDEVITLLPFPAEVAVNENARVLTLEEAFVLARRNNSSIEALNDAMIFAEQQRRSLAVDYDNTWGFSMGLADQTAATVSRAIRSTDLLIGSAPAQTRMRETLSDFFVLNAVYTIQGLELDVVFLNEMIAVNRVSLNHVELRNRLGMASDMEVASARQALELNQARLRSLNIGLESQRAGLNNLLGLPRNVDVVIEHDFSLELGDISARVGNITAYADRQIARDPSLQILRRQLDNAQHNYDTTQNWIQNVFQARPDQVLNSQANATDRAGMLNELNAASRGLRDATNDMREGIHNTYNQLRQLEELQEMTLIDLQAAHDLYNTMKANFAAGMTTQHAVNDVRLLILNAEANIIKNAMNYKLLLFTFDSPFML